MGVSLGLYSSLAKILPENVPYTPIVNGVALKGENFSFQADVYLQATATLFNTYRLRVEGDLKKYLTVYEVAYVPVVKGHYPTADDFLVGTAAGLYPDVLMCYSCGQAFVLHSERHKTFWVKVQGDVPCGKHTITVILSDYENREITRKEFVLEVLDCETLPCDIMLHSWLHCDCICEQHGVKPFSRKFYTIFGKYLQSLVRQGTNAMYTPLFTPALDTQVGEYRMTVQLVDIRLDKGEYQFLFEKLRTFIRFVRSYGIEKFEMCHLFTQWGAKHAPKIMANVEGKYRRIFGWDTVAEGEEYTRFLQAFLPKLVRVLQEENVGAVFHLSDEPGEAYEQYARLAAIVKPLVAPYPIVDACPPEYQKSGYVDCAFVSTDLAEENKTYIENCAVYYCCGQHKEYLSNRFITMPSVRNRVLGAQLYANRVKGFLHWGYNFYHSSGSREIINPFLVNDGWGAYPAGDCFIVYPNVRESGVYESIRGEVFLEGLQDYKLLKALESAKGRETVEALLQKYGIEGFCKYPHDEQVYLRFIEDAKRML